MVEIVSFNGVTIRQAATIKRRMRLHLNSRGFASNGFSLPARM